MSLQAPKVDGLRVLSLDGGDLNCISQLKILEEFMQRLAHDSDCRKVMRPCQYFHSITGVGASGMIAILLGELGLSVEDSIDAFLRLCEGFSLGEKLDPYLRSEKLVSATKVLLQRIGVEEEAKLCGDLNRGEGCKVSVPYMAAVALGHCRMLRNYDSAHSSYNPTIIEAIRIAWATPGLFSSVHAGPSLMQEVLVSAVNSVNNPTLQAIEEAHNVFKKDQRVCCVLSLGTGKPVMRSLEAGGLDLDQIVARETENVAEQLKRCYNGLGVYFRLSMDRCIDFGTSADEIGLRAGRISASASSYLLTHDASESLENCLKSSRQASHITLESLYRTRANSSQSSRGLPPLSAFFVAREKPMNDIVEALRTRMPGSPAIGLILGLSGTGKTQISLKYAYDHSDEYDHILFVDASSTESLEKALVTQIKLIDRQLGPTNVDQAVDLLVNPEGKLTRSWLIIMDNADDGSIKLQYYIPSCDHGCILITSRNAALSNLHPDGHVEMGVMSREEAVDALLSTALDVTTKVTPERPTIRRLRSNVRTKQDEDCAGRIVDELGYLPLAVIQAACYIKKQKCLHQYLKLLQTSRNKLLRWPASVQRDTLKYAHSIYAAFDTILQALSARALKFLEVISFVNFSDFPTALIGLAASLDFSYQPEDLLDRSLEYQLTIDRLREIFCPEGHWDPMELDKLLEELQNYSLVSLVAISTIVTLRFHPLLHAWANDRLSTSDRAVLQSAAVRLLACGTNRDDHYLWPYLSSHMERFPLMTDELHVNDKAAFTAIMRSNRQYSKVVEVWENIHATVRHVHGEKHLRTTRAALYLADAYGDNGDWQRMESMERKIVEIRKETLGETHMETLHAMANLARTCKVQGNHFDEALNLELEVLRVRKELCGPKHHEIVQALADLATTYQYQERYKESVTLLVEALDMITSLTGRAHPATIRVMKQLARCYSSSGESEEAMKLDQGIIELQRAVRGDTHVETLTAMAELYYKQAQTVAAEEICQDLVNEMRRAVGGHHEHILGSLRRLACSNYHQSRYAEAEVLWREVLAARDVQLGADDPDTVDAQNWLFHSIYEQKRYGEAESIGLEVVAGTKRVFGDKHRKTISALDVLARSIHRQFRYAEAEGLWREVVAGWQATLGPEEVNTLDAQNWLFHSIYEQKRFGEAEALGRDLMEGMRRILGDEHVRTLSVLHLLADCIFDQARHAEAEEILRKVVARSHATLGPEHADTVDAQNWLFHSVYEQRRYDEAESLGQEAIAGMRQVFGDQHIKTLFTLHRLAVCIYIHGRHAEAEALWREVVAGRHATLGPEHADTVDAWDWLFRAIFEQKRFSEAEALGRDLIKGMRQTFGEEHAETLSTLHCLAACIHKHARYAEAEVLWKEVIAGRHVTLGANHADTVDSRDWLFHSIYEQKRFGEAEALGRDLMEAMRRAFGDQHAKTLLTLHRLAVCIYIHGQYSEAETLWRELVAARRETLGVEHRDTLAALHWVGKSLLKQKSYVEAEMVWREVVAGRRATLGAEHADTVDAQERLFCSIYEQKRYDLAEALGQDLIPVMRRAFGDKHPKTISALDALAVSIYYQSRYKEAEALWREIVAARHEILGDKHTDTLNGMAWLFHCLCMQERYAEAEVVGREVIAGRRITLGDQHSDTLNALDALADCIFKQSSRVEAQVVVKEIEVEGQQTLRPQREGNRSTRRGYRNAIANLSSRLRASKRPTGKAI